MVNKLKSLLIPLLCLSLCGAWPNSGKVYPVVTAPVVLDAVGSEVHNASASSFTYTGITVGSGTHRALVVAIIFDTSTVTATSISCTWDSGGTNQAMTSIVSHTDNNSVKVLFGLVAPTSGNKTLACSWTGAQPSFVSAISFSGVNQTGGTTSFPNSQAANAVSLTITTVSGDYAVAIQAGGVAVSTQTPNQWFLDNANGVSQNAGGAYGQSSGSSLVVGGTSGGNIPTIGMDVTQG